MEIYVNEIKKNPKLIARLIDHTNVNPNSTKHDIEKLVKEAKKYNFYSIVVLPYHVKFAKKLIKNTEIKLVTVIGFPFGVQTTDAKIQEIKDAYKYVDEFDIVMNRPAFKSKDYSYVLNDLKKVVESARGKITKVIIETPELTSNETYKASKIVLKAGANFVKTAVGLKGPAKPTHIKIMKKAVGNKIKIKASGGIRDFNSALKFLRAGASRIGASHSVDIIKSAFQKIKVKRQKYFHE